MRITIYVFSIGLLLGLTLSAQDLFGQLSASPDNVDTAPDQRGQQSFYQAGESIIGLQGLRLQGVISDPNAGGTSLQIGTDVRYGYFASQEVVIGVLMGYDLIRVGVGPQTVSANLLTPALFGRYYMALGKWSLFAEVGAGTARLLTRSGISIAQDRNRFAYGIVGFTFRAVERVSFDLGIGLQANQNRLGFNTFDVRSNLGINLHL